MELTDRTSERKPRKLLTWALLIVAGVPITGVTLLSPFLLLVALRDLGQPDPVTPDRGAIVGTWTNPDGARLAFRADGTYTASGMSYVTDGETGEGDPDVLPADGTGTWTISVWNADTGSGGGVFLDAGQDNAGGAFLDTTGDPANPSLFATIGDPDDDDHFTFTKQPG